MEDVDEFILDKIITMFSETGISQKKRELLLKNEVQYLE